MIDSKQRMATKIGVLAVALVVVVSMVAGAGLSFGANANAQAEVGGSANPDASASSQADTDGATEINSCTVIDEPGSYVLIQDIEDSEADVCIDIQSSNVHFDGNNHTVDGVETEQTINESTSTEDPPTSVGVGANVESSGTTANVTVNDVTVTDWFSGVRYNTTTDGLIEGIRASDNGLGVDYRNSCDGVITKSTAENNSNGGIILNSPTGEVGSNNAVTDSSTTGNNVNIGAFNASDTHLSNNTATGGFIGIVVGVLTFAGEDLSGNTVTNSTTNGNFIGIGAFNASDTRLSNNTVADNFAGIVADERVDNTTITEIDAENNSNVGILASDAAGFTIADNSVTESGFAGIALHNVTGSILSDNTISDTRGVSSPFFPSPNPSSGLSLDNVTDSTVEDITATNNSGYEFLSVNNSTGNSVESFEMDTATVSFDSKDVALDGVPSPPADPENRTNIGQYVNATNTSTDSFLDIDVSYGDADVEEAGVDESTLRLFEFANEEWTEVEGSAVDTDANVVSGNITDFSVVAPLGAQTTEQPGEPEPPTEPTEPTKPTEPTEPAPPAPGVTYYQVDFVVGEPIEKLRSEEGYYTPDRLIRFAHGSSEDPVTHLSAGEFITDDRFAECIESNDITVENGVASQTFTVRKGCEDVTLTLASYEKVGPGWSPETEAQQEFTDSEMETFEPGTHTLEVALPGSETDGDDGSAEANGGEESTTGEGELSLAGLQADADGDDDANLNDEFLTYENTGDAPLDLLGWTVEDSSGTTYTFPDGFTLDPGAQVTLYTGRGTNTDSELYWGQASEVWNNGADSMTVSNADGETVLERSYP